MQKQAVSEKQVHDALQLIVDNRDEKALNYAFMYAFYGLEMSGAELVLQCRYVLSNMTSWRGETAKSVREVLKAFVK